VTATTTGPLTTLLSLKLSVPHDQAARAWGAIYRVVDKAGGTVIQGPEKLISDELTIFGQRINEAFTAAGLTRLEDITSRSRAQLIADAAGIGILGVRTIVRALAKLDPPQVLPGTKVPVNDQIELLKVRAPNYLAIIKAGYNSIRQLGEDSLQKLGEDGLGRVKIPKRQSKWAPGRSDVVYALSQLGYSVT
jgi:hypothetical protein